MKYAILVVALVSACATTRPALEYDTPEPAAVSSPTPKPSQAPLPPFPLVLTFTPGASIYGDLVRLVNDSVTRWNGALGEMVFKLSGPGRVVTVDLMNSDKSASGGTVVGCTENLTDPHWVKFYPGVLPPDDRCVVLHELGHLLGCDHSLNYQDVMYFRNGWATDLTPADIENGRTAVSRRRASRLNS